MSQEQIVTCKFNQKGFSNVKQYGKKRHCDEICENQSEVENRKCEKDTQIFVKTSQQMEGDMVKNVLIFTHKTNKQN